MPAHRARQLGLPMPVQAAQGVRHRQTGLGIRSGYLRFRVVGMDPVEYTIPCFFLGEPHTPPDPSTPPGAIPRNLLGMPRVIDYLRIYGDGTARFPHAPHGMLIVESK
jgi:hypothetical protein